MRPGVIHGLIWYCLLLASLISVFREITSFNFSVRIRVASDTSWQLVTSDQSANSSSVATALKLVLDIFLLEGSCRWQVFIAIIGMSWSVTDVLHTIATALYLVLTNIWSIQELFLVGIVTAGVRPYSSVRHK